MTTATVSPDCTRKGYVEGKRAHRAGQWICRRCLATLRDSLEIATHLRTYASDVNVSPCRYLVAGSTWKDRVRNAEIAFECSLHGWEEA